MIVIKAAAKILRQLLTGFKSDHIYAAVLSALPASAVVPALVFVEELAVLPPKSRYWVDT